MTSFDKEIIGKWENDFISYVFDKQGNISIQWIKESINKTGSWFVEKDEITINYGADLLQTWKGRINHVNGKELSITDLSNEIGTVDVFYKKELNIPTEKKNFKEKLTESVLGVFALAFFIALFGGVGYLIYEEFKYESHEYTYFIIGITLFTGSAISMMFTLYDGAENNTLLLKGFFIFYASLVVVPILYYILVILFAIITFWYYLFAIGIILSFFVLFIIKENWIYKSIIILISIASLYFLYDAKSILKIRFEVEFNNKTIGLPDDE